MRHDVAFGQGSAAGAEPRLQILKEAEVDIDLLIGWAIEGANLRRGDAAAGGDLVAVNDRLGRPVLLATLGELARPELLDAVDVADDAAVLLLVGIGTGGALPRMLDRFPPMSR
jgi:hypothetical protein